MSIITIISDFGYTDHYVAAIKASIYKLNSNLNVVDISHNIKKYNISHAAHSIRNVYKDFPERSIHIICVKASEKKERINDSMNSFGIVAGWGHVPASP